MFCDEAILTDEVAFPKVEVLSLDQVAHATSALALMNLVSSTLRGFGKIAISFSVEFTVSAFMKKCRKPALPIELRVRQGLSIGSRHEIQEAHMTRLLKWQMRPNSTKIFNVFGEDS